MKNDQYTVETEEIWRRLNGQVHPVILRFSHDEYPYHGVGTAFILEHEGQLFVVSAQHVLDNQNAKSGDFTILVRDAGYSLIFDLEAVFQPNYDPHFDLLIRRIAPFQHELLTKQGVYWVGTEFTIDPQYHQDATVFYVFGYSEDDRAYDYDAKRISAALTCLPAKLASPSLEEMVTLQLLSVCPKSLRGFSGSPVFAVIDEQWMFAGMLTLAAETGLMNLIPAYRIVGYLQQLHGMVQSGSGNLNGASEKE
ncbi:hypothetical protein LOY55_13785 [Pseudomonas sp. B21-040]|uniref:hypothetical protein n=1 Tax=Pseudomonas sp. B21-040 TaxID=2895486 RepID=UPI00215FA431|nr:hypothetical protein [Pseudomonas sp. B21-040]UVL43103.1 hypothetical protein LOY55_13785 [Pseudomonas sp. B21-040]